MKTKVQVSDIPGFYADTYFGKSKNSSFIRRNDIIEAESVNLNVNEWSTAKYKAHLIKLETREELEIPVSIPKRAAVLHFVCAENLSIVQDNKVKHKNEVNTNHIWGKQRERINHRFCNNKQYEYFKIFLTEESILMFSEYYPDSIDYFEDLIGGKKALEGNCCLTTLEMKQVIAQIRKSQDFGKLTPLYFESKVQELLCLHLLQENNQKCESCSKYSHYISQVNDARNILEKQYATPPTIRNLARMVGMSETVLKASFKLAFGITVYGYLHNYRMSIAHNLLVDTTYSIAEIAARSGYEHASHFTTAFKRMFGVSPGAFRRKVA